MSGPGLVILARLRSEFAAPGQPLEVHAYPVPADGNALVLTAPCGDVLERRHGERVRVFEGVPCVPCLLLTLRADGAIEAAEVGRASAGVFASGGCAVGLRGDRVRHLVSGNAIRSMLDGREVVHTMCGHLGWGPLASAPEHWPVCSDCVELASRR